MKKKGGGTKGRREGDVLHEQAQPATLPFHQNPDAVFAYEPAAGLPQHRLRGRQSPTRRLIVHVALSSEVPDVVVAVGGRVGVGCQQPLSRSRISLRRGRVFFATLSHGDSLW